MTIERTTSLQLALFAALGLLALPGCDPTAEKSDTSTETTDTTTDTVTDTSTSPAESCEAPESILDGDGAATGYERCEDGTINRVSVVTRTPTIPGDTCAGTEFDLECTTDADCTAGSYGQCLSGDRSDDYYGSYYYDSGDSTYCGCVYSCATDTDCDTGEVCVIPGLVPSAYDYPTCVRADCATNSDCESEECSLTSFNDGCGYTVNLVCRDPAVDICRTNDDCADSEEGNECVPNRNGVDHYTCTQGDCDIGRPLMVDGVARKASGVRRADWSDTNSVSVSGLNRKTRRALAKHWSGIAAMEHASVASFARFALQLMAIGAPPALLLETQAAGADEIRHAQTTFGIASRYAGSPVGPGPLDLTGMALDTDRIAVLRGLITEACVGETLGVAEALAAAESAADPSLQAIMTQIAEDETRHSALAWKTLKWMLDANPELKSVAADAFAEAIPTYLELDEHGTSGLDAFGVLSPERRLAVRQEALERVVLPCIRGVLGTTARSDYGSIARINA